MALTDQRVVIIGGTSGIGYAVAEAALADGAEVVVGSSQAANVETAVRNLGNRASGHTINVRDEADVAAFFEKVGSFDHLVFTAGDWGERWTLTAATLDLARAPDLAAVRYWGALAAIKHAVASMPPTGSITLTDGMIAHRPRKGTFLSTAMGGALEHLGRGLAVELAPIRVNVVCPGAIRTGVWDSIPEESREEQLRRMTSRLPIARVGEPAEVAEAYLYLMRAGYTTGQVLHVDGGGTVI
jgi:NAD(P)-dependent dehydrogenase (short-subunit alcohol dehydrogenase family)